MVKKSKTTRFSFKSLHLSSILSPLLCHPCSTAVTLVLPKPNIFSRVYSIITRKIIRDPQKFRVTCTKTTSLEVDKDLFSLGYHSFL